MDEMELALREGLPALGLTLEEEAVSKLCRFGREVILQNRVMNLTAIVEPAQVARLHLLDSLSLLAAAPLSGRVIDVGCGAGFPGVPLKIARPDLSMTLLDSLGKRTAWLERTLPNLGISAQVLTARAEEAVSACRETYDFALSRAVARLPIVLELTAPYVKVGGTVLAMKGSAAREEAEDARRAIPTLGLKLEAIREFPIGETRHQVVILRKTAPTPAKYPRRYAKIKQSPL